MSNFGRNLRHLKAFTKKNCIIQICFAEGGGVAGHEALQGTAVQVVPVVTKGKPPYQEVFSIQRVHINYNFSLKKKMKKLIVKCYDIMTLITFQRNSFFYSRITLRFFETQLS